MIKVSEIITDQFRPFWIESRKKNYLRYVLKGGRGSGKSFHIPLRILFDVIKYPVSAVAFRKVQTTCLKSVYASFKSAANVLGVRDKFRFVDTRLEITYIPRGNKIYCMGADDPDKIKSLLDADFPIAIAWWEELAEFKDELEITSMENSILRKELRGVVKSESGKDRDFDYSFYYSYNPPKRRQSWVNKKYETAFPEDNNFIHHSIYIGNPHLSKWFTEEAELTRKKNERRYRWIYLGEPIGSGIVPFDNLKIVKNSITDEMVADFDNIRNGIDYGYATDPLAFTRWHYDKKKNGIYAIDEIYGVKISNRELAKKIMDRGYEEDRIMAESAEPKSNAELRDIGLKKVISVKKGPDSVQYGEEWLGDLDFICIDPLRTPNIAREFENIDYQTDRDGNPVPKLMDKDNHTIDSTRYAFSEDMKPQKKDTEETYSALTHLGL